MDRFSNAQLMMMRSLVSQGWPVDLIEHLPSRCGAADGEWQALADAGLIEDANGRFRLTDKGRQAYKRARVGRYF
jgi:hypothetical protein